MVKLGNFTGKFKEGMQAYVDGISIKRNPYDYGGQDWEDWKDGHTMAKAFSFFLMIYKDGNKEPSK